MCADRTWCERCCSRVPPDVDHEALAEAPEGELEEHGAARTLETRIPPDVDHEALAEAPDGRIRLRQYERAGVCVDGRVSPVGC